MKKIGLTGGMGTGKSTATWMFQEMGAPIINADAIAHRLMEPKTLVWKQLFERYGDRIMQKGGEIDRAALADIVFGDQVERKYVERVVHPRVHEEIVRITTELERKKTPYVIVEIPLLFETGWEKEFDVVVVVRCDYEQQVFRCMEKFRLSREEAESRIAIQRPLATKVAKADFVIDNAGSKTETLVQTQRLYRMFEKGEFKPRPGGRSPS
jgi:dephospho-CoA kinase